MKPVLGGAVLLLVAGVALVAWSVAEGGASVFLLLVVPVVTGSSLSFLLGVVALVVGFLLLPFGLAEEWSETSAPLPSGGSPSTEGRAGVGGFVLVGPVPIVFGSFKGVSRRTRVGLAIAGAVLLTVAIVAFVWLLR